MMNFITKYLILKLLSVHIFSRPFAHSPKRSAEGLGAGILLFWLLSCVFPSVDCYWIWCVPATGRVPILLWLESSFIITVWLCSGLPYAWIVLAASPS